MKLTKIFLGGAEPVDQPSKSLKLIAKAPVG